MVPPPTKRNRLRGCRPGSAHPADVGRTIQELLAAPASFHFTQGVVMRRSLASTLSPQLGCFVPWLLNRDLLRPPTPPPRPGAAALNPLQTPRQPNHHQRSKNFSEKPLAFQCQPGNNKRQQSMASQCGTRKQSNIPQQSVRTVPPASARKTAGSQMKIPKCQPVP